MISHEPLVEEITSRAQVPRSDAARVIKVTLAVLNRRLEAPQRQRLRKAVPGPERDAALATVPPASGGIAELLEETGRNLDTTPERALYLAQVVLARIAEADPELVQELRGSLPTEFATLFSAPARYSERMHAATDAPAPLTPGELDAQLRRRPEWSGDVHHLTRTVVLPGDRLPPLLSQIDKEAQDLNHRCEQRRTGEGVTFTLRTRSVDAVTTLDLALADRIDAAVTAVGSGGRPG